jgi:sarcosine oxidase
MTHDCIVLGAGGVGSGVFHHLAKRGASVLAIDRFGIAHDRGSSHGRTRIIRRAYFEHPDYVPLCERAFAGWASLEAETGRTLYEETGLLLAGPAEGEAIAGCRLAAERYGIGIENLAVDEARRRFPQFGLAEEHDVLLEPRAGFLHVEECVRSHVETGVAAGGTFLTGRVREWTADAGGVTIRTDEATFRADQLVLCPGAYHVLPPGFRVLRKVQLWFPAGDGFDAARGMPAFYFEQGDRAFYGLPRIDGRTLKVAEHTGGEVVGDPGALDRTLRPEDVAALVPFLASRLPGVDPTPSAHSVCMYTMSPDGHFVVGRSPEHERVCVALGLSGHGFKFTGVLGQALADLVTTGRTDVPIGFLSADRFVDDRRSANDGV